VKRIAPPSIRGYVVESLMARGYDEPFTLYGLIARGVETDAQRSYVTFHLDATARFSDGTPVTAEDVIFSWQLLRDKGRPNHRTYYAKVAKAETIGERAVRFDLSGSEVRELALILGLMPVLAKHAVDPERFEDTSFQAPLGTGPYLVGDVDPGKSLILKRNPHYWGRELPINRGLWNFDEIRFDYYREANSHLEAFKRGLYDMRNEHDPGRWQTAYDFSAVRDGRVVKEALPTGVPKASSYYVFNTRRAVFSDVRVREAISLLFDFEWINHGYFFDLYRRSASFFDDSELSSYGRPADYRERALLAPFAAAVRADVLDGIWSPPVSDGSGRCRPARYPQLYGREERRGRHDDRRASQGGGPWRFRCRSTRARSRVDLRLLRNSAVLSSGPVDRALDHGRPTGGDFALRLPSRNLVARAEVTMK